MRTIDRATQEAIIDILPQDGNRAMELMCQLLANLTLSVDGFTIDKTINLLRENFKTYEGT
jgi:hypothetical protein